MQFTFFGNTLMLKQPHETKVCFDANIKSVKVVGEYLVVLLDPDANNSTKNVFALNEDGKIIWQIPGVDKIFGVSPYMDLKVTESNELIVANWNGFDYHVDLLSGKILGAKFLR